MKSLRAHFLFAAFATVTLFEDPQISVRSVTADSVPGGVRFTARGQVRRAPADGL